MITINVHSAQFLESNGYEWDTVETREFETPEAANEGIECQLTEIEENWRDMWGEAARFNRTVGYICCFVDGVTGVFEVFEILEVNGVKVRKI